jgi:hypothetical protein
MLLRTYPRIGTTILQNTGFGSTVDYDILNRDIQDELGCSRRNAHLSRAHTHGGGHHTDRLQHQAQTGALLLTIFSFFHILGNIDATKNLFPY